MPPQPPGENLSPGEILHLEEEEANLLNSYLKNNFVRTVASVSFYIFIPSLTFSNVM